MNERDDLLERPPMIGQITFLETPDGIEVFCTFGKIDEDGKVTATGHDPKSAVHREAANGLALWESYIEEAGTMRPVEETRLINGAQIVGPDGKVHGYGTHLDN